jgi:hypothetical protein
MGDVMAGKKFSVISKNPTLFAAVNKDRVGIYHELVSFDVNIAQEASDRNVNILCAIQTEEVLPHISRDPECLECQYGDCKDRYWKEAL